MQSIHRTVRFHLVMGKPSKALDAMIGFLTHSSQQELLSDAILLKSQYESAAHNYRQGMMPRAEFDLIQNRTVNALQAILKDLQTDEAIEGVALDALPVRQTYWGVVGIVVVVIAVAGWLVFRSHDMPIVEGAKPAIKDTSVVKPPVKPPKVSTGKDKVEPPPVFTRPPEITPTPTEPPPKNVETEPVTILYVPDPWGEANILADGQKIGFTSSGSNTVRLSVPKNTQTFQLEKNGKTCNGQKSIASSGKVVVNFTCR